jgi:hypothetical protein
MRDIFFLPCAHGKMTIDRMDGHWGMLFRLSRSRFDGAAVSWVSVHRGSSGQVPGGCLTRHKVFFPGKSLAAPTRRIKVHRAPNVPPREPRPFFFAFTAFDFRPSGFPETRPSPLQPAGPDRTATPRNWNCLMHRWFDNADYIRGVVVTGKRKRKEN